MKIFEAVKNLPFELRAILDEISNALEKRVNAERAAAANLDAIMAGERRIMELEASSKELDAQAIKAEAMVLTDSGLKSEATKAVKAADKAAAELADERRANERRVAAAAILEAEARAVDEMIPELEKRFDSALARHGKQILAEVNDELAKGCIPLIPIIQSIAAVSALFPNGGLARRWLDCAKLISPVDYQAFDMSGYVRVRGTDLLASNEPLPALPDDAADAMQKLVDTSRALKRHQKYQPPKRPQPEAAPLSPAEQRRFDEAAERVRQGEEEYDRRQERSMRKQTPEERRKWTLDVRYPGTPAPGAARNGIADGATPAQLGSRSLEGNLSDEYRWLGDTQPGDGTESMGGAR